MKKFLFALIVSLLVTATSYAEIQTFTGTDEYTVGETETQADAKERSRLRALRNAQEQAGVLIQSRSRMKDLELVDDEVVTIAAAVLKVVGAPDYKVRVLDDGKSTLIVTTVTVQIDTDDVDRRLKTIEARENPKPPVDKPKPIEQPAPPVEESNSQPVKRHVAQPIEKRVIHPVPIPKPKPIGQPPAKIEQPVEESRPYLGVTIFDKPTAARYGYNLKLKRGVYVFQVKLDSPAGRAGFQRGDVILSIDGTEVNSVPDVKNAVAKRKVGDRIKVLFVGDGEIKSVYVTLERTPQPSKKFLGDD